MISPIDRDHPAHRHLVAYFRERMSDVSQNHFFASWLRGFEYILWNALHGGPREGAFTEITDAELEEIAELSALVGGWHTYDRFIPLDEWLPMARAHELKFRPGDRP